MKLKKVLLRWYKSFHLNYRGDSQKGETEAYRPWNTMSPPHASKDIFPFIEIPIEDDITTIVGANESGKSHLLNAIKKVVVGFGIDDAEAYERTDLCHFAGVRTHNVEAWPNIGLQFVLQTSAECNSLLKAAGLQEGSVEQPSHPTFALILAPDGNSGDGAKLFFEPNPKPTVLDKTKLAAVRNLLPSVQFIDSKAQLASEIALSNLIAAYSPNKTAPVGFLDRRSVEKAAKAIEDLVAPTADPAAIASFSSKLAELKTSIAAIAPRSLAKNSLEVLLFSQILGIESATLNFLHSLNTTKRGYIEGQIAKWNEEINDRLNLSHFWRQDEQFSRADFEIVGFMM